MKAEKGDLIRIVNSVSTHKYNNGDIFEVVERGGAFTHGVFVKEHRVFIYDSEYVIHRKAGEEDEVGACASCGAEVIRGNHVSEPAPGFTCEVADAVNPQHYKQGRVEVIDIIEDAVQGADPFEAVCQANIIKYSLRYRHKNGVEDLRKSVWYTEKLIAYLDAKAQLTPADAQLTE